MVSMSMNKKKTTLSSKEIQSELRSLNDSAYETIEDFIIQVTYHQ